MNIDLISHYATCRSTDTDRRATRLGAGTIGHLVLRIDEPRDLIAVIRMAKAMYALYANSHAVVRASTCE
jgi:hypothetical protein